MKMIYNELGKSGVKISALSFGAMRWPSEEACHRIINRGIDLGMNYVDTSTGYIDGKCEGWTGRAVRARRDEIYFSAKAHWNDAPKADVVRKTIAKSLKTTGLDYFDFFQMWGIQDIEVVDGAVAKGGTVEGIRKAMAEGLIRHGLGFTFHGSAEVFKAAVDSGEFVCATLSYNLMNRKEEELLAYAAAKGVGVIVMNPLAGGVLGLAGTQALDFLCNGESGPSYGALRFLLANRSVTTSIVGVSDVREVDRAVEALPGAEQLDEDYRQGLIQEMEAVKLLEGDFCTGCGYCKECPEGVNPSRFMKAMRDFVIYGVDDARLAHWLVSQYPHSSIRNELDLCTECGQCEEKCPQHLKIIEQIRRAKAVLAEAGPGS